MLQRRQNAAEKTGMFFVRRALLFFACLISAWAQGAEPIDVVFDLDWTLIYTSSPEAVAMDPRNTFSFGDKDYRFSDDAVNVLRAMHANPAYRVSFLSGGDAARNQKAIEMLYEMINADGGSRKPFKVGSLGELHATGAPETAPFTERFKKDLERFLPGFDPTRTVLVDDSKGFAFPGQERNMFWMQNTYDDIPDFARRAELSVDPKYLPPDEASWLRERRKLLWTFGSLEEARRKAELSGEAFVDALHRIHVERDSPGGEELIKLGRERMFGALAVSDPCAKAWASVRRGAP